MNDDVIKDIIQWFEGDTIKFIDRVMSDDLLEPEYSAVTCSNRIIRIIQVKNNTERKYETIEEYLSSIGYSEKDINIFMRSREKELEDYEGYIYKLD